MSALALPILLGIGTATSVGTGIYSAVKANQAADDAKKQMANQAQQEQQLETDAANQKAAQTKAQNDSLIQAQQRRRIAYSQTPNAGGTILTSPLGVTGSPGNSSGPRTVLGA